MCFAVSAKWCFILTNEEDEAEKKNVTKWPQSILKINWNVGKFNFPHKHCWCLDKRQPGIVKKHIFFFLVLRSVAGFVRIWWEFCILVQHDVKSETESDQEQGIPDEECDECLQYFVEHGYVDVVLGELGVAAHQRDQRRPAQDDRKGREVALRLARQQELLVGDVQNGPCDKGVNEISRNKMIIFEKGLTCKLEHLSPVGQ